MWLWFCLLLVSQIGVARYLPKPANHELFIQRNIDRIKKYHAKLKILEDGQLCSGFLSHITTIINYNPKYTAICKYRAKVKILEDGQLCSGYLSHITTIINYNPKYTAICIYRDDAEESDTGEDYAMGGMDYQGEEEEEEEELKIIEDEAEMSSEEKEEQERCFEIGIGYRDAEQKKSGDKIKSKNQGIVRSVYKCQELCQKDEKCVYFNWLEKVGCYFKESKSTPFIFSKKQTKQKRLMVTGPKFCHEPEKVEKEFRLTERDKEKENIDGNDEEGPEEVEKEIKLIEKDNENDDENYKKVCQEGNGEKYTGTVSKTKDGIECQRWTDMKPNYHHQMVPERWIFGLGAHNYCRNPNGAYGVWCYGTKGKRWEYCDVPVCS